MKKIKQGLFLFILTTSVIFVSAQKNNLAREWSFHSLNSVGLLEGQTGSFFQIQTINGAQYKSWFGGIGLGLDFYRYRTIPLFFDIRKQFGESSNKLFIYTDMGINFSWLTDNEKINYYANDKFSNGLYADMGLGYKIGLGRKDHSHLLLSLGYSLKNLQETYDAPEYSYPPVPNLPSKVQINYNLNRLTIKIGWAF